MDDIGADETLQRASARHGRIDDIEVLRAFAILFTLMQHLRSNLISWSSPMLDHFVQYFGLSTGVDLFFAISGFVIMRSLIGSLEKSASRDEFINATISFWVRRAWRILPSSWLWLGVILVLTAAFNRSGVFGLFHSTLESALSALLNVANFRLAYDRESFNNAVAPYWSLSLEEQFYLALPVAVFLFRRRLPYVLGAWVLIGLFLPRMQSMALSMTRTEGLLLGVLLALWTRHPSYRLFEPTGLKNHRFARIFVVTLLLLCLAMVNPDGAPLVPFAPGLVSLIGAALVFIASYDQDYLWADSWLKKAMLWVGSRSYAMYLIHMPVYRFTRELWWRLEPMGTVFDGRFTVRYLLTAGVLIVVLSELNYRLVEMPLRNHGARIAARLSARTAEAVG